MCVASVSTLATPLIGQIDIHDIKDRRVWGHDSSGSALHTAVMNGKPVFVRVARYPVSDAEFEAEYRLLVRIRDIPQSGCIIGYCDNQTLVFALRDSPIEALTDFISRSGSSWRDKTEKLFRWVEFSMKLHALDPRKYCSL